MNRQVLCVQVILIKVQTAATAYGCCNELHKVTNLQECENLNKEGTRVSPQALTSLAAWGGRGAEETMWWRSIIRQICTEDRITWYGHNSCWPFVNKVYCACCCFLSWVVLWVFYRLIGTRSSYWLLPVQKQENHSSQNLHPGYMRRLAKLAGCAPKDREGGRFYQSICWRPLLYLQTPYST